LLGALCPGAAATFTLPTWVAGAPMLQLLDSGFSIGLCCMPAGASIAGRSVLAATCFRVYPDKNGRTVIRTRSWYA